MCYILHISIKTKYQYHLLCNLSKLSKMNNSVTLKLKWNRYKCPGLVVSHFYVLFNNIFFNENYWKN